MSFRLGIVGAGRIADTHLQAALASSAMEVTALTDPHVDRCADLAKAYDITPRISASLDGILEAVDGVVIATPNATHFSLARQCIDAGVHTLIEKPLVTKSSEGQELCDLASGRGVTVAVGYCIRFRRSNRLMARVLAEHHFGRTVRFAYQCGTRGGWSPASDYILDREMIGGGVLVVTGTHWLDRMLAWFGYPEEILDYEDDSTGGPEANCRVRLRFPDAVEGTIRLSKTIELPLGMVIETESGLLLLGEEDTSPLLFRPKQGEGVEQIVVERGPDTNRGKTRFQLQLEDFVEAAQTGRPPMVSAEEALGSVRIVEDIYAFRTQAQREASA